MASCLSEEVLSYLVFGSRIVLFTLQPLCCYTKHYNCMHTITNGYFSLLVILRGTGIKKNRKAHNFIYFLTEIQEAKAFNCTYMTEIQEAKAFD